MSTMLCVGRNCNSASYRPDSRRTAAPGLRFCAGCFREIKTSLIELPEIYDDCESALVPRRNQTVQRASGRRPAAGILLDDDVVTARSNILSILASWSALVADERAVRKPRSRTPVELTSFLLKHLNWLLVHTAAEDFADEILQVVRETRRSAYIQPSVRFDLGACVHPGCHAPMTPAPAARDGRGTREVRCTAGHTWQPHEWLQLFHRIRRARESGKK